MAATIGDNPAAPKWRVFRSSGGTHLLVIPHSRLFDIEAKLADALELGDPEATASVSALCETRDGEVGMDVVPSPRPQSLSLNVSSACNLSCGYCYAGRGRFGGRQTATMSWDVARAAMDRLFATAQQTAPITIGFIGGEPFMNRALIHRAVGYAAEWGRRQNAIVCFSITTNATMLDDRDIDLLRSHPFAVTVSIDGGKAIQDHQRPAASGKSSFDLLNKAIRPLIDSPGKARIAARVTVARRNVELRSRFADIVALGFRDVGFSPVRMSSANGEALVAEDWKTYLDEMIAIARSELETAIAGAQIRLANLAIALKQIHRGASMPYPCGAGGGYFSVSADGIWYACHRAIGQDAFAMGDNDGMNEDRRQAFLRDRHVHAQPECRVCWARYLCSGGCHQEASARSDSSCGFIRGWLDFCLAAYCELSAQQPQWFSPRN